MLEGLLIGGVALIIVNLIVRDQTQYRIGRLRTELLGLRSEEKRLSERRDEVELMVAQVGDALVRADRRRLALEKGCEAMAGLLEAARRLQTGDEPSAADAESSGEPTRSDG